MKEFLLYLILFFGLLPSDAQYSNAGLSTNSPEKADLRDYDPAMNENGLDKAKLQVFPNPTSDYFELSSNELVDQLVVYNLLGRRVRTYDAVNGTKYYLNDLPSGLYLISLLNEKEGIIKTMRLSKLTLHP